MRGRANHLFAERDLRAVIDGQVEAMLREIDACAGDRLASDGGDAYCASLLGKYGIVPIALDEGVRR